MLKYNFERHHWHQEDKWLCQTFNFHWSRWPVSYCHWQTKAELMLMSISCNKGSLLSIIIIHIDQYSTLLFFDCHYQQFMCHSLIYQLTFKNFTFYLLQLYIFHYNSVVILPRYLGISTYICMMRPGCDIISRECMQYDYRSQWVSVGCLALPQLPVLTGSVSPCVHPPPQLCLSHWHKCARTTFWFP